jgi:hypothetical protein
VKRGWITWDQSELPRAAFDARLERLRWRLAERDLPAAVIYTDVWRSNRARYFSNFMPYWNRALLVVPYDSQPILLSGLSPRVYPWIRSVTILDEIRPSPNLAQALTALAREKGWTRLGILDLLQLPADLAGTLPIETVNLSLPFEPDPAELSMYRTAALLARTTLAEELPFGRGLTDHAFTARLEWRLRRDGAEDLVILLTNGRTVPAPPRGETLGPDFSISLALEYRGHWVKIARSASARDPFPSRIHVETLSGPYPYEMSARLETPALLALRFESQADDLRLFHGDTYLSSEKGLELL